MKQFENGHILFLFLFFIIVKWRTWVDWLIFIIFIIIIFILFCEKLRLSEIELFFSFIIIFIFLWKVKI